MEKIASFTIDHERLLRGLYVSRKDRVGTEIVTTFDIRMKEPNREPVLNIAPLHTIEHLGATYLRTVASKDIQDKTVYFGPMGCRTGFYVIFSGDLSSRDILPTIVEMFRYIAGYTGDIPGASSKECGNYLDQNLEIAKYEARKFLEVIENAKDENLNYPN
ncbi:S-ribosylhomocysteine lyase [Candidatus Woesearchaeota archaeon]|nr:S-ribosylhomocysteine lyase [Candidatus Woesearchaeota archaeon]